MDFTTAATGAWAIGFASIVNENGYESVLNLMRHRTGRCDGRSGDMVCETKQCEGSDFRTDEGNAGLHWKKFGRSQAVVK